MAGDDDAGSTFATDYDGMAAAAWQGWRRSADLLDGIAGGLAATGNNLAGAERDSTAGRAPPFPPIVAAGPNGAKPHARPSDRTIVEGDLVVLDFGAVVDGYCSDMTRTVCIGEPTDAQRRLFDVVAEAQHRGAETWPGAARSGPADGPE